MLKNKNITITTVLISLGIVFGDIGTSVLYVMKSFTSNNPNINKNLVLGMLSLVIWTLTIQTTIKYVLIALNIDNHGEGGIFALFTLIKSKSKILLTILAMIGGATLLADGIITPAVTVTSAIEGLSSVIPTITTNEILIIVIIVFLIIFSLQKFGTKSVGKLFGPLMFIWFSLLFLWGIMSIVNNFTILKAFNPYYAIYIIINYPSSLALLGTVFLCTTGAEALYSDLGHCGKNNIKIAWIFVKICLIINYLGQGAYILSDKFSNSSNPFYAIVPEHLIFFQIIISTLAAIIASQSLITGSFTLVSEAIKLNLMPKLIIKYTTNIKGQVFIPIVNIILFLGSSLVVLFFKESSNMEAAYGLSISITMFITTILITVYIYSIKNKKILSIIFLLFFSIIELEFLIANSLKFFNGGYVTIFIGLILFLIMYIWYKGDTIKNKRARFLPLFAFSDQLMKLKGDTTIPKYATNLVYLTSAKFKEDVDYSVIYSILNKQPKRAENYFFIHVDVSDNPYTMNYEVTTISPKNIFKITLHLGFRVNQHINVFTRQIINDLIESNELDLQNTIYGIKPTEKSIGDFRFVIIEEILGNSHNLSQFETLIMNLRLKLKSITTKPEKWFGLDTSIVTKEYVPLNITQVKTEKLKRI